MVVELKNLRKYILLRVQGIQGLWELNYHQSYDEKALLLDKVTLK